MWPPASYVGSLLGALRTIIVPVTALGWLRGTSSLVSLQDCPVISLLSHCFHPWPVIHSGLHLWVSRFPWNVFTPPTLVTLIRETIMFLLQLSSLPPDKQYGLTFDTGRWGCPRLYDSVTNVRSHHVTPLHLCFVYVLEGEHQARHAASSYTDNRLYNTERPLGSSLDEAWAQLPDRTLPS